MPKNVTVDELKAKAKELRLNIIKTANYAGSGHVGGSLSAADVLAALYFKYLNVDKDNPDMFERDRFILSKGHCALAYVPTLAMAGFVPMPWYQRHAPQHSSLPSSLINGFNSWL